MLTPQPGDGHLPRPMVHPIRYAEALGPSHGAEHGHHAGVHDLNGARIGAAGVGHRHIILPIPQLAQVILVEAEVVADFVQDGDSDLAAQLPLVYVAFRIDGLVQNAFAIDVDRVGDRA